MVSKYERTDDFAFGFDAIKHGMQRIANILFEPDYVMADAAGSINAAARRVFGEQVTILMCFVHVKRAVDKRPINNNKNKPLIKADIDSLSLCPNEKTFEIGCKLFLEKWKQEEASFVDYFQATWINRCNKWYVGAGIRVTNDNNLLEGFNGNMKIHQTFYQRKGLAEFKVRLLNIVRERSQEYIMDKQPFKGDVTITNRAKKAALAYSKTKSILHRKQDDGSVLVYMKKGDTNANHATFPEFVEHMFDFYVIKFDNDPANWTNSSCSCPAYAKRFMCKHILCIAFKLKLLSSISMEALEPNKGAGAPAKAPRGNPLLKE